MTFANFDIAALNSTTPSQPTNQRDEAAVRKMASDFEALLLRQLTSSINPSIDGDEDGESLFGQGEGLSLSRQLFSEQMADTMAKNGGVGLADMILKQVLDKRTEKAGAKLNPEAARALDAARSIRGNSSLKTKPGNVLPKTEEATPASASTSMNMGRINRGPQAASEDRYPDAIIISRASDSGEASASLSFVSSKTSSKVPLTASSDTPIDDAPADPIRPAQFMTEDDVLSQVRPRRVRPLPDAEKSFSVSGTTRAPVFPRARYAPSAHAVAGTRINAVAETRVSAESAPRVSAGSVGLQMYVRGPIRSRFGPRIDPIDKVPRFHKGIDIAAPAGTPIGAAAGGQVVFAGPDKGHGNMVVIEHADGTLTRYAHASKLIVKEGDYVESGQTIALVGSTGHSTGPHLHFEVIRDGTFIDPLKILSKDFALARR